MAITVLLSCESEFDPNIISDPIAVVYSVIDPDDSLYLVKLTKVFVCQEALRTCTKNSEVHYFENPVIELELLDKSERLLNRSVLQPVQISQKEDGVFSHDPAIAYGIDRYNFELENDDYGNSNSKHLIIKIFLSDEMPLVSARTILNGPPRIIYPGTIYKKLLNFYSFGNERLAWNGFSNLGYELELIVHYTNHFAEHIDSASAIVHEFIPPEDSPPLDSYTHKNILFKHEIYGDRFFKFLRNSFNNVTEPKGLEYRQFESFEFIVRSFTKEYWDYTESLIHDGELDVPVQFNIINGIGLFTVKRTSYSEGHSFHPQMMDSLVYGEHTKHLKFVKW